jgi:hypothetical protein
VPLQEGRQEACEAHEILGELLPQLHEESRDEGTGFKTLAQQGLAELFDMLQCRRVAVGQACGEALHHVEEGST